MDVEKICCCMSTGLHWSGVGIFSTRKNILQVGARTIKTKKSFSDLTKSIKLVFCILALNSNVNITELLDNTLAIAFFLRSIIIFKL